MPDDQRRRGVGVSPMKDGGTRHALLMLYLAPFLAGAARTDFLSIPIFAALFSMADVARSSPAIPFYRRLLVAGAINLLIVTAVFVMGRAVVWSGLIPQAPIELWLTLGMAAIAALILRRIWANHHTARFAADALAALTGTGVAPQPENHSHALGFELDQYGETAEARGLTQSVLDDLTRALVKLDRPEQVQSALLARSREGPVWQAALYNWLAHPFVSGNAIGATQMADLFLQGMAETTLQTLAARMALVWAETHDFGPEKPAVQATVAAHLAALLPNQSDPRYLRPCLEALDRTLRRA